MRGEERVHERLEVGSPPLRKSIANLPSVIDAFTRELCADGCEALVEAVFKAVNLVVFGEEVVAWSIRCRQHTSSIGLGNGGSTW